MTGKSHRKSCREIEENQKWAEARTPRVCHQSLVSSHLVSKSLSVRYVAIDVGTVVPESIDEELGAEGNGMEEFDEDGIGSKAVALR